MSRHLNYMNFRHIAFCGMLCWGLACQPETSSTSARSKPADSASADSGANTSALVSTEKISGSLPASQRHGDSDKYVGSQACAKCHAEISRTYETHPMSRSMFRVEEVALVKVGESERFDPPGPCQYSVFRDEHGLWQSEEFIDQSGEVVYRDVVPVHYAVGSGRRGRTFLTDRGGLLTQGVATWYSTRRVWDLSPGYAPTNHARFSRRISDGCVTCHVGRTNNIPKEPHRYGNPVFTEMSIGCERCHGPGKDHVDFRESESNKERPDPIVNPASLGFSEQLSVCYQCHLHGEERIVRSGRGEFDFRPGERFSDVWVTFVSGSGIQADGATSAVSQVEQMHASLCFTKSGNRMTCTSCHDPHQSPSAEQRTEFYRVRCLSCHEQTDSACRLDQADRRRQVSDDSCIDCHMPARSASDVPHTAQTDHRVIRFQKAAKSEAAGGTPALFDPVLFPVPEVEQRRARGLLLARQAEQVSSQTAAATGILLLSPLAGDDCVDVAVLDDLASCHEVIGNSEAARLLLNRAFRLAPRNESVLRGLVVNSERRGDFKESLRYLNMMQRLYPEDGPVAYQQVRLLSQLGRKAEAFDACRKSALLMPHDVGIRTTLIQLAKAAGETELAEEQQRLMDRMQQSTAEHSGSEPNKNSDDK